MLELLLIPAVSLGYALLNDSLKGKEDDRKKIQVFFEVSGIAIRKDEKLHYPVFLERKEDDRSTTYVYKLPLGMPSKLIQKVEDVVSEGLNKPVRIKYDNYKIMIRVFSKRIPQKWCWDEGLVKKGEWQVPMGQSLEKLIYHDFDKTPHMVLGGLTRMGKTVFMKVLLTTLIEANPENAHVYLIDLKEKGLEFSEFSGLKQVEEVADSVEKAHHVLKQIMKKIEERGKFMKENGYKNIVETKEKDRYFVIVDEGAVLAPAKGLPRPINKIREECQYMLSYIATVSGGLGFRLILATQYPTVTSIPSVVKQMSDAKLGFRLPTYKASEVVLDESGLETLPSLPGRAIYKTDRLIELQVPFISDKLMWKHLKQYEVKKDEHPNAYQNKPSDDDFDLD
ncbi:FtsK/SpoIIIE domain-containing protein [Bacillus thuringiensis]|uniref:Cell division protein FtsK n=1 Tax=Bacillus thuringiensis TaxID=1428 RepID=A0A9W3TBX3_BACTU|nr:FtsK/SpoIIIE domain-containing protein [Bacillus thuringiensis]AQY38493.1 cell division protein FtsK [Bacillus thuringiensis]MDR4151033.1 cell division protein FtsK [Bacillus thuringiensis]MEC3572137.1 FtsK/SpoIIIE domain-containing protein [Bacillus thuringiensis]MED2021802.1 FtsK/SpoIIIE domain-containing protein [Bacillus thuringiensis]MED2144721.1 FtsK/SpoIIIE domain-containing protein [Bacillus thuringiensis]